MMLWISFFSAGAAFTRSKTETKKVLMEVPCPETNISSSLLHPTGLFEILEFLGGSDMNWTHPTWVVIYSTTLPHAITFPKAHRNVMWSDLRTSPQKKPTASDPGPEKYKALFIEASAKNQWGNFVTSPC
ncbi:hypothetical protein AVEN_142455-1 [Araneus ventricosus]|uniref:Uncharacterized protein n=1 Tax=Araneus ventricosus TaxID=182803 RepID=A0A4Y2SWL4_ARAVE|nr:hypothetical protein AVEN_142455-1 [Araneus ventricosus]